MNVEQLVRATDTAPVEPAVATSAGRAALVEAAYVAHYRDVYRYALSLTRSADDAEEIAADVFGRALQAWTRAPEPVLPWLLVVARRLATDRWRRAHRLARILVSARHASVAPGAVDRTEFWAWFSAICRVLTERQREVLVLRYQRDLSDDDIAEVMGLSTSGVRSLVARAIEALRAHPEVL